MIIGITDCSKYENYRIWIESAMPGIEIQKLDFHESQAEDISGCHGILLSGGEDVHPSMYNKPEYLSYCYPDDISLRRDEFEWKVMQEVVRKEIPVLGICRGLQFINVFFGGSLIPDLTTWGKFNHSKLPDNTDRYHSLSIDPSSYLYGLTGIQSAIINSNHHQSADRIGKDLVVSAIAADGTVEAIEKKFPEQGGWLLLVQWHPERMSPKDSPLVSTIRSSFLNAAENYKLKS